MGVAALQPRNSLSLFDATEGVAMRTLRTSWALALLSAIIPALCSMPANAGANRTWVSGTGTDTNPCTIAQPCASFQGALAKTNSGGEINCLNPGDFSNGGVGVTITQSVSIVCDGASNGGVLISGADTAVTINAPGTVVYLSGLNLNGLAATGTGGVTVNSGSTVYIVHCTIHAFSANGISPQSNENLRVVIKDSIIVNNFNGVSLTSGIVASNGAVLVNTVIDGNTNIAAGASGTNAAIAVERSTLSGSPTGIYLEGSTGVLIGPSNTIAGSITGTTESVPFK